MNSAGNNSNTGSKEQTNSLQTLDKVMLDIPAQCDILITVEAIEPQHNWIGPNTMATANSNVFLVTNSIDEGANAIVAFSNLGSALDYVKDSHGDLNPEGAALMFDNGTNALVPATIANVKKSYARNLRFVASNADAASVVAGIQSQLKGALQACALVGVDPSNVAKVADLRGVLELAQDSIGSMDNATEFTIAVLPLHKRKHTKRDSVAK